MWSAPSGAAEPTLASVSPAAREVLLALKKCGEARAEEIAEALGITPSGVRQHLSPLRAEGFVTHRKIHAGPGRPKFAYRLTDLAEDLFPKTYHELTNELLEHIEEEDPELLVRIFERRRQRHLKAARKRLAGKSLDEKVAMLVRILDEDGYLADFERRPDGTYLINLHNCAIWAVAVRYGLACSSELEFLREALPEAEIDRVAHKVAGAYVCAYEVRPLVLKKSC
ncbi:MAG TPA: ArsR family transcriptional regulator [Actinomycetota bacterium]|nr:ArsR family transcriptional regulator [Actinomycetota bacterium]